MIEYWTQAMEKQVGRRLQILLEDPILQGLYQEFGAEIFRRSSVFHDLDKFLRDSGVRGKCAFEVGTWNGLTAVILSRFFDKVVTIDIINCPLKHDILKAAGVKNVECINIKDNAEKRGITSKLNFNFAYLDGDHAHDTETDFALVKKCGNVLFHEFWPHQRPVFDLVHTLPPNEVVTGGSGLALWRKA